MSTEDKNPYGIKTVLDWDDGRKYGDPIMVTTTFGWAFEAGDEDFDGTHVASFDTVKDAKRGTTKKALQQCDCPRCAEGLMRAAIAAALDTGNENSPQADGFRSFPEWMEIQDMAETAR